MQSEFDRRETVLEMLEDLQSDAYLLHLVLLGARPAIDTRTYGSLLRVADYLEQHTADLAFLLNRQ